MTSSCMQTMPKRYVLALLAFFGFFFAYIYRADLSVAIVEMSAKEAEASLTDNTTGRIIARSASKRSLKWSPVLQGYILSSFFYGYIVTQLPAGLLTNLYGGRVFFGAGIGICAIVNLLIPLAAKASPGWLIFLRIIQGLSQGFIFPSMHCLWSKWSPACERSRLTTFSLSGCYIGTVFALGLGGIIGRAINWEAIFYIFGAFGIVWCLLWFLFVYETPSEHATILADEKNYLETSVCQPGSSRVPWLQIIKSPPVWAIIFAHFAENWGFYTMLTDLPTFLADKLDYEVDQAGMVSSLPYFVMAVVLYSSGYISDYLIEKRKMSCTSVRKGFCCSGLAIQCFIMLMIPFVKNSSFLISMFVLAIGVGGMAWSSFGVNHLDIGTGYANVLMSISNFFATIPGIVSPTLTGHLTEDKENAHWNIIFVITSVFFLIGAVMFGIFASGDVQDWSKSPNCYNTLDDAQMRTGSSSDTSSNQSVLQAN